MKNRVPTALRELAERIEEPRYAALRGELNRKLSSIPDDPFDDDAQRLLYMLREYAPSEVNA